MTFSCIDFDVTCLFNFFCLLETAWPCGLEIQFGFYFYQLTIKLRYYLPCRVDGRINWDGISKMVSILTSRWHAWDSTFIDFWTIYRLTHLNYHLYAVFQLAHNQQAKVLSHHTVVRYLSASSDSVSIYCYHCLYGIVCAIT